LEFKIRGWIKSSGLTDCY